MLSFTTDLAPPAAIVRLSGELDLATVVQVHIHLETLIAGGHQRLILDLSRLEFIDSTGIGMIIGVVSQLHDGQTLALARPTPTVAKVFALTGLVHLIEVHDSDLSWPL